MCPSVRLSVRLSIGNAFVKSGEMEHLRCVRPSVGWSVRPSVRKLFIQMLKGDNFLRENHQGGPNLTLLNLLNVLSLLNVLNMPKDASLASGPCLSEVYL